MNMKRQSQSPVVAKEGEVTMDFISAMSKLPEGKKIHKLEWKNREFYAELKDGQLQLHKPDSKHYAWILNRADIEGTDWIVL